MRKLLRSMARANMERLGMKKLNKKIGKDRVSHFSLHWREYITFKK